MIMPISSFNHFKMLYNDFMIFFTEIIIIVYCFIIPYKEFFSRHVTANRTKELFLILSNRLRCSRKT